ncbi:hypothetical protein [Rossellomorea marisflavi]|uniref:hypothetical protein n=1 Tax=Rossellomorea marisflavi TaxID=189381 RepID=UPI0020793C46|nr:hypothetical protein [Rossellomorea marisflavi]USK90897.1 hypothetical protein LIT29_15220 [Rossellomorea marisflavi]
MKKPRTPVKLTVHHACMKKRAGVEENDEWPKRDRSDPVIQPIIHPSGMKKGMSRMLSATHYKL